MYLGLNHIMHANRNNDKIICYSITYINVCIPCICVVFITIILKFNVHFHILYNVCVSINYLY